MADNNNKNGSLPAWVEDCEAFAEHFKKPQDLSGWKTKSITFDPLAQNQLPEHIKAKMQGDRHNSEIGNAERISKIEKILNNYRRQEDFSDRRLAAYISKNL